MALTRTLSRLEFGLSYLSSSSSPEVWHDVDMLDKLSQLQHMVSHLPSSPFPLLPPPSGSYAVTQSQLRTLWPRHAPSPIYMVWGAVRCLTAAPRGAFGHHGLTCSEPHIGKCTASSDMFPCELMSVYGPPLEGTRIWRSHCKATQQTHRPAHCRRGPGQGQGLCSEMLRQQTMMPLSLVNDGIGAAEVLCCSCFVIPSVQHLQVGQPGARPESLTQSAASTQAKSCNQGERLG